MKVYSFVFVVGLLNLAIPFLGFPILVRRYMFVTIGITSILYALYVRAIIKEQEAGLSQPVQKRAPVEKSAPRQAESVRTIEQVVEMREAPEKITMSDVKPKRRGRKPKMSAGITIQEE